MRRASIADHHIAQVSALSTTDSVLWFKKKNTSVLGLTSPQTAARARALQQATGFSLVIWSDLFGKLVILIWHTLVSCCLEPGKQFFI
jgi:hypothetical protein